MSTERNASVTQLLQEYGEGREDALEQLLPIVFDELHALAARHMRGQQPGHTLQATALVNEAFVKLFRDKDRTWEGRRHFLGLASRVMRSVLVDHARARGRQKRSPDGARVPMEVLVDCFEESAVDLLALDDALEHLGRIDPDMVRLVELRFFGGLSMAEVADVLDISLRTAEREWQTAKAWLRREFE